MMVLVWIGVALTAIVPILGIGAFALEALDSRFAKAAFCGGAAIGFLAGIMWLVVSVIGFLDAAGFHAA